jgi:hypothetical protein
VEIDLLALDGPHRFHRDAMEAAIAAEISTRLQEFPPLAATGGAVDQLRTTVALSDRRSPSSWNAIGARVGELVHEALAGSDPGASDA